MDVVKIEVALENVLCPLDGRHHQPREGSKVLASCAARMRQDGYTGYDASSESWVIAPAEGHPVSDMETPADMAEGLAATLREYGWTDVELTEGNTHGRTMTAVKDGRMVVAVFAWAAVSPDEVDKNQHDYQPREEAGSPCEVCGFGRHHPWHPAER